jgi:hypothetical protein
MKGKWVLALLLSLVCLGAWLTTADAVIYRLRFQINTFQRPGPLLTDPPVKFLSTNIQVNDSMQRPYDAVQSLKVTAPDSAEVDLTQSWNEVSQAYTYSVNVGAGPVPAGTYTAIVVGKDSSTITQTATLDGSFLDIATITSPAAGSTTSDLVPTITWTAVPEAQYYILNISGPPWGNYSVQLYRNTFTVPAGVLKPASNYTIYLNAHNSDKLVTKSSTSANVSFITP